MSPVTIEALRRTLLRHSPAPRYWIAYSGGMDSRVLLDLCIKLRNSKEMPLDFRAIHVHHGLHRDADAWSEHCARVCRELNLSLELLRVDAGAKPGDSPEEAARHARYSAFRRSMGPADILLTAQHRDDQAETLLLQLMRGAGLAGLAAMPEFAPLEPGFLLRPLLGFSRADLHSYAEANMLHWIEDPSNADASYDRNFLRNEIIPRLQRRWPGLSKALARTAAHCAEAQSLLEGLARDLCRSALSGERKTLCIARLCTFKEADQRLVLREWIRMQGFRMPARAVIERILREVLPARRDKAPIVSWREGEVRRYRDHLYLLPRLPPFDASIVSGWEGLEPLDLPAGNGRVSATRTRSSGISAEIWRRGKITVGYRQGGERLRLPGRTGTHELKKLFQEAGIEPWLRERAPLVFIDGELAAVAGWWVSERFAGKPGEDNVAVVWTEGLSAC